MGKELLSTVTIPGNNCSFTIWIIQVSFTDQGIQVMQWHGALEDEIWNGLWQLSGMNRQNGKLKR